MLLATSVGALQAAPASADVSRILDPRYFAGVNVPWFHWACDFGCGEERGVSSPYVHAALADGFGKLRAANVHTVRWWMFEGDPWQIYPHGSGTPIGLNPEVFKDVDAALALAEEYDLAYEFVLFSSPGALPPAWVTDPDYRQRLADVLAVLFQRYRDHPRILAWEVFNEPEWAIDMGKVPLSAVQEFVKLMADTVHANTGTPVTVGSADISGVSRWTGLGLDFYSPHWYDYMKSETDCALCTDAAAVAVREHTEDAPIVIGEFEAGPNLDPLGRLNDLRNKGYAGAWAWSLFPERATDNRAVDLSAFNNFSGGGGQAQPRPEPAVGIVSAFVEPKLLRAGETVTVHADVEANSDMTALVGFDVLDMSGQAVVQISPNQQPLAANTTAPLTASTTLPATVPPGDYTVRTVVSAPDGSAVYAANDSTGSFSVVG
jgi:hypothetical protein